MNGDGYSELVLAASLTNSAGYIVQYAYPELDQDGNFVSLQFADSYVATDNPPAPEDPRSFLLGNVGPDDTGDIVIVNTNGITTSVEVCAYDSTESGYFKCYDEANVNHVYMSNTAFLGQFDQDPTDDELIFMYPHAEDYSQMVLVDLSYSADEGTIASANFIDGCASQLHGICRFQIPVNGEMEDVLFIYDNSGEDLYCVRPVKNTMFEVSGFAYTVNGIYAAKTTADDTDFSIVGYSVNDGSIDFKLGSFTPGTDENGNLQFTNTSSQEFSVQISMVDSSTMGRPFDFQKRSLLLGAPMKVKIKSVQQPKTIIGAPPMHVDYIKADLAAGGTAKVNNFTVFPGNFNVGFDFESGSSNTSDTKSQSSHGFAHSNKVGVSTSFSAWGVSVGASMNASAQTQQKNSVDTNYVDTTSTSYQTDITTSYQDYLWVTEQDTYLFYYPVVALKALTENDAQTAWLCFSAPQVTTTTTQVTGEALEWYQPIHEQGNILSYPSSRTQISGLYPDIDFLNDNPNWWYTDNTSTKEAITWSESDQSSKTVGTTHTHSCSMEESVHAGVSESFFGVGFSASTSYSHKSDSSSAVSKMVTSTSSTSASQGVTVTKDASFAQPELFSYGVQTYISGEQKPANMFDTTSTSQDLNTYGPVRVMFSADTQASYAGYFWTSSDYARKVDIALNHPTRWNVPAEWHPAPSSTVEQSPVPAFNSPLGTNFATPRADLFYHMKGLFITPKPDTVDNSPAGIAKRLGSQVTVMNPSQTYSLTARVYNYSLKATSEAQSGSTVKVAFLGCKWDNENCALNGDSFLVGEVQEISNIDGHGNGNINWAYASVDFDPQSHDNDYLVFWVVVWLEDSTGALIAELPDHGLTAKPDLTNAAAATFPKNPSQIKTEEYSNNVGFYCQPISVVDQSANQTPDQLELFAETREAGHFLAKLSVDNDQPLVDDPVLVTADLQAGDEHVDGITVYFYDGRPEDGGRVFDIEHIGHVFKTRTHRFQAVYVPREAGRHTIYVKALKAGYESVEANVEFATFGYGEGDSGSGGCFMNILD